MVRHSIQSRDTEKTDDIDNNILRQHQLHRPDHNLRLNTSQQQIYVTVRESNLRTSRPNRLQP